MSRAFDWLTLLREQRIHYIEQGANVKRGEVSIRCPFCGSADPSQHMGLNLETGWWSCWRNRSQHSGKSPLRLIMRLLDVPYAKAREIAGLGDSYIDPEGFDAMAAQLLGRNKGEARPMMADRRSIFLPDSFARINDSIRTRRFWNYLYNRGFDLNGFRDVPALCEQYGLRAGNGWHGKINWQDRIIIPYYQDRALVTWTGRAIAPATIRYKDLRIDDAITPAKQTLFNHDAMLKGGSVLVIQEGPFDVLKVDFYGQAMGIRSVGLSTNSVSEEQAFLLQTAVGMFDRIVVMLDTKDRLDIVDSLRMQQDLAFIPGLMIEPVPYNAGDGGNLSPSQVLRWSASLKAMI